MVYGKIDGMDRGSQPRVVDEKGRPVRPSERGDKNAALLAAAPDLLRSLATLVDRWEVLAMVLKVEHPAFCEERGIKEARALLRRLRA